MYINWRKINKKVTLPALFSYHQEREKREMTLYANWRDSLARVSS